jgi:hypothetical protein
MEGLEKGLPFPMNPCPGVVFVQHSAEGFIGRMIASNDLGLNICEGETLVDHMRFVSSTLKFTSAITPHMIQRILFKIAGFVLVLRWGESHYLSIFMFQRKMNQSHFCGPCEIGTV